MPRCRPDPPSPSPAPTTIAHRHPGKATLLSQSVSASQPQVPGDHQLSLFANPSSLLRSPLKSPLKLAHQSLPEMLSASTKNLATPKKAPRARKPRTAATGSRGKSEKSQVKTDNVVGSNPSPSCHNRASASAAKHANPFSDGTGLTSQLSSFLDSEDRQILQTPRRGRRMGKVNMGWESPLVASTSVPEAPHTLPKRKSRSARSAELQSTPTKRKASQASSSRPGQLQMSLVDTQGWASAVMLGKEPVSAVHDSPSTLSTLNEVSTSARHSPSKANAMLSFATMDSVNGLRSTPKLVPVEVAGLGRVAVHRELADQISEYGPYACSGASRRHGSFSSENHYHRTSDTEGSSSGSSISASTNPTSIGTPCPGGVSPSFSLSSHFPASDPCSPGDSKQREAMMAKDHETPKPTSAESVLREIIERSPSSQQRLASQQANLRFQPKLGGSQGVYACTLPTLEWPDSPGGPWAAAGQHIDAQKRSRLEGIQSWLENDLDESDSGNEGKQPLTTSSGYQHHPMVAKALRDRARKLAETATIASVRSKSKSGRSPKKKLVKDSRVNMLKTPRKREGKARREASVASSSRRSVATSGTISRFTKSPVVGCRCGVEDESIMMVQCDHCHRWLHLACVGIAHADDLDDEWYCDDCCEPAHSYDLSPALSLPTTASLAGLSTPGSRGERNQAVAAAAACCEPVFVLPVDTPIHLQGTGLSSSIALAPSPPMYSRGIRTSQDGSARKKGVGRARAERVGWRATEPGSPLARKSRAAPETPRREEASNFDLSDPISTPSVFAGFSRADWGGHSRAGTRQNTTPSPRLRPVAATPSRMASSSRRPSSGANVFGEDEAAHPADIFSTPSRLATGSSPWGLRSHPGAQTPSRSAGRHQRSDSGASNWAGLSTPIGDLLGGAFGTEHSTAYTCSSVVFSSGGLDPQDDHGFYGQYASSRAIQLQSPSSSIRAATRTRQCSSTFGGIGTQSYSSGALLKTPELQPRHTVISSVRGSRFHDDDDPPTSSSPFPRTPTFDQQSPSFSSQDRHNLGLGLPSSSSKKLARFPISSSSPRMGSPRHHDSLEGFETLTSKLCSTNPSPLHPSSSKSINNGNINGNHPPSSNQQHMHLHPSSPLQHSSSPSNANGNQISLSSHSSNPKNASKNRQVSSEIPLGLGIGIGFDRFDLDDVLDWS
ncbi:hypothetical protein IE53DRAFT_279795 [Violaceomyces palustris]|uniref:Uncharacterized protein n=1 Tax=Violaceomyces palustris TaxID=1673888 RepID=A0ACD0P3E6_9BASI|nr:hypothetical protein IE53DRAFT_279795 [Violaceomyces palustris]